MRGGRVIVTVRSLFVDSDIQYILNMISTVYKRRKRMKTLEKKNLKLYLMDKL